MTWQQAIGYLFGSWGLGMLFGFVWKYVEKFLQDMSDF